MLYLGLGMLVAGVFAGVALVWFFVIVEVVFVHCTCCFCARATATSKLLKINDGSKDNISIRILHHTFLTQIVDLLL